MESPFPALSSPSLTPSNTSPPPYTLLITSHGHIFPPLDPPPAIQIDLRRLPNPPVQLRKKYLGISARLRKEFFGSPEARKALEDAVAKVEATMEEFERVEEGEIASEKVLDETDSNAGNRRTRAPSSETPKQTAAQDCENEDSESKILRVGVQCEMGRHRSVAMAKELGDALEGRKGWVVEVRHRDIGGKAGGKKGWKGRERRMVRGSSELWSEEEG